jgi:hypothetical protein
MIYESERIVDKRCYKQNEDLLRRKAGIRDLTVKTKTVNFVKDN